MRVEVLQLSFADIQLEFHLVKVTKHIFFEKKPLDQSSG